MTEAETMEHVLVPTPDPGWILAVDGYEARRAIVVTGATNKVGAFGVRLMPRAFIRWAAGKLQG